ncbi:MAG: hypothetical protein ACKN97_02675 [Acidobacteriota bacterium]
MKLRTIRAFTAGTLAAALLTINSMVVLASSNKVVGEILIADRNAEVTVNGEVAKSGRSLFSGSSIDTPSNSGAVVTIGSIGRLELAPSSSITLSFDDKGITGSLNAGKVTVLSATGKVEILSNGTARQMMAGETAEASTTQADNTAGANTSTGGNGWWIWAAIFGGAIVGVVAATTSDNNRTALGGGTVIVSPSR